MIIVYFHMTPLTVPANRLFYKCLLHTQLFTHFPKPPPFGGSFRFSGYTKESPSFSELKNQSSVEDRVLDKE